MIIRVFFATFSHSFFMPLIFILHFHSAFCIMHSALFLIHGVVARMITVSNLTKKYGDQILFDDVSFVVGKKERVGVVGRNGHGKSTLFGMILGHIEPDSGTIMIPHGYRIGHLQQHISFTQETILSEACTALPDEEKEASWKVEKILAGLGFVRDDFYKHPSLFSGGFQIRLNLAKLLVSSPEMLLLDEPNNYLDIVAIRWLIEFLRAWKGELMLITHDRHFMDRVTTHTLAIHRRKARKIEGSTEKLYQQIELEEDVYEKTRRNEEKQRRQTERFISRFRAKARLGGLVQSRVKLLEKQEKKEKLGTIETFDFSFHAAPFPAAQMMSVHNIAYAYNETQPLLIDHFSLEVGKRDRIAVVGKNGKGKSTLLRLFVGELTPNAGTIKRHPELKTAYFGQTNIARLVNEHTIVEEILSADPACPPQRARTIAGTLMFSGDVALKKIAVLSGGERSRVLLGKLLVTPAHLLLLDEPTHHLDIESAETLLDAIESFDGSVIMVTHNELFLERCANRLIVFDRGTVRVFDGTYQEFLQDVGWEDEQDTAHFQRKQSKREDKIAHKKMKAALIQTRFNALNPLEQKIKQIEQSIIEQETAYKENTQLLIEASEQGNVENMTHYSKKEHELKPSIDALFQQLEIVTEEYNTLSDVYKKKMNEID